MVNIYKLHKKEIWSNLLENLKNNIYFFFFSKVQKVQISPAISNAIILIFWSSHLENLKNNI